MLKRYDIDPAALAARAEYRVRKKKLHRLLVGWMVFGMIVLWTRIVPFELQPYVILPVMIAISVAGRRVWRCPRCDKPFGSRWRVESCPRCNVVLEADDRPGTA